MQQKTIRVKALIKQPPNSEREIRINTDPGNDDKVPYQSNIHLDRISPLQLQKVAQPFRFLQEEKNNLLKSTPQIQSHRFSKISSDGVMRKSILLPKINTTGVRAYQKDLESLSPADASTNSASSRLSTGEYNNSPQLNAGKDRVRIL